MHPEKIEPIDSNSLKEQTVEFSRQFVDSAAMSFKKAYDAADKGTGDWLPDVSIEGKSAAASTASELGDKAAAALLIGSALVLAYSSTRLMSGASRLGMAEGNSLGASASLAVLQESNGMRTGLGMLENKAASSLKIGLGAMQSELRLTPGLAFDTAAKPVSAEARSFSQILKNPLPRFEQLKVPAAVLETPMSAAALKQSQQYVETGLLAGRMESGVRLPVVTDSKGFDLAGNAVNRAEKFIVVDKANDDVLKAVIDDAKKRFAGHAPGPQLAEDLRTYVGSLLNRHNLDGPALAGLYEEMLRRGGDEFALGQFVCRGSGVCLPRSALYKTLADELALQAQMREGYLGIMRPQPHVWTEVKFQPKFQIYDASHAPNPLFRYTSVKH